ncbi:MAG: hypothetical protein ABIJ81_02410 [Patescibacteria group bacterium]
MNQKGYIYLGAVVTISLIAVVLAGLMYVFVTSSPSSSPLWGEEQIQNRISPLNYCSRDSDCIVVDSPGCPFGCWWTVNKDSNYRAVYEAARKYMMATVIRCEYKCSPVPSSLVCRNNICFSSDAAARISTISGWAIHPNQEYGYQIDYPPVASLQASESNDRVVFYLTHDAALLHVAIQVSRTDNPSLEQFVAKTIDTYSVATRESTTFHGVPAIMAIEKISEPETMTSYFEYFAFIRGNFEYLLSVGSKQAIGEADKLLVDQMLFTFKFID